LLEQRQFQMSNQARPMVLPAPQKRFSVLSEGETW
jgi:hypothetical protein